LKRLGFESLAGSFDAKAGSVERQQWGGNAENGGGDVG
jgi:hypothetical protein